MVLAAAMMAQAEGRECVHLRGLEGPGRWEGGSRPAGQLGARGDVGLWAGAPLPQAHAFLPPRVQVEFYVNENTFKERLKLFFIKNQRSSEWGLWGGRAEGLCWSGRGNGRVPCLSSLPPSRVGDAGTLEGCAPPGGRAGLGSAPQPTRLPGTTVGPPLWSVGSLHLSSQQEPGHLGCRMGCRGGACGFWSLDL